MRGLEAGVRLAEDCRHLHALAHSEGDAGGREQDDVEIAGDGDDDPG